MYGSEEMINKITVATIVSGVLLLLMGLGLLVPVILHHRRKRKNSEFVKSSSVFLEEVSVLK